MPFILKALDIKVERTASPSNLYWPVGEEADDDGGLACNRQYADFRGMSWQDLDDTLKEELQLLERLLTQDDPEGAYEEEVEESDEPWPLYGLDVGVASTVVALSAAGCTPATSCHGGALGRPHLECHPLAVFCAKPEQLALLLRATEAADVGLTNIQGGYLLVYSGDLRKMMDFANRLGALRYEFDALSNGNSRPAPSPSDHRPSQPDLL